MMQRFAMCNTEGTVIKWQTPDTNPMYGEWKKWEDNGPFHLSRMVRAEEGAEKAISLLRVALNQFAGTHAFVYQTTWPVIWDLEFRVLKQQGLEVAVIEEGDWLVATTLVFPGFKQHLEWWTRKMDLGIR